MALEINEINPIPSNEIPGYIQMPENFNVSDETNVGENNYDFGESEYIKNKRKLKIIKRVSTTAIVTISVAAGGTSIANLLNGNPVTVNSFNHEIKSNVFHYDLDIKIDKQKCVVEITNDSNVVYTTIYESTGTYNNDVILDFGKEYTFDLYSSNMFDLKTKLSKYSFSFQTLKE